MLSAFDPLALMAEDAEVGRVLDGRFLAVAADRLHAAWHRLIELYALPDTAR